MGIRRSKLYIIKSLIVFRSITILLLIIILINPVLLINEKINSNNDITYLIDNSKSMSYSINKAEFLKDMEYLNRMLQIKNIKSEFFLFGDSLRKISNIKEIDFSDSVTDINSILNNLNLFNSSKLLLLSDGLQNQGMLNFSNFYNKKIISFGIGDEIHNYENLSLDSLEILNANADSIFLKMKISSELYNSYDDINLFLSNAANKELNIGKLEINPIDKSFYHTFSIVKNKLSQTNTIHVDRIPNETSLNDNYISLLVPETELLEQKFVLLSGRLSANTNFIKKKLNEYSNISIEHYFLLENIDETLSKLDPKTILIFDSFPITKQHLALIKDYELSDNYKFIFFQGPILRKDANYLNSFLTKYNYSCQFDNNKFEDEYIFSNNKKINSKLLEKIAPINISTSIRSEKNVDIFTDKKNVLIDIDQNLFFFIEDLNAISNETKKIFKYSNFDYLYNLFINKLITEKDFNNLNIYSNQSNFYVDEKFNIYLNIPSFKISDFNKISLNIENKYGDLIFKISDYTIIDEENLFFNLSLNKIDEYFIYAQLNFSDSIEINSPNFIVNIEEEDKEKKYAYLNVENLNNISLRSNGEFYNYDYIKEYINTLDSNSSIMLKLIRYNVFNFQSFWFIIVLMLFIEWFIRKKKGFL